MWLAVDVRPLINDMYQSNTFNNILCFKIHYNLIYTQSLNVIINFNNNKTKWINDMYYPYWAQ